MPCAAQAEDKIVNNTREVCPGVILTGMELAETVLPRPSSRLFSHPPHQPLARHACLCTCVRAATWYLSSTFPNARI